MHCQAETERPKFYVEETNPPIIEKADFDMVQKILDSKKCRGRKSSTATSLNCKIYCKCGCFYKPLKISGKKYWECRKHNVDTKVCGSRRIPEKDIYKAFITMINKLRNNCKSIVTVAISQAERLNMKYGNTAGRIKEIDKNIAELSNKQLVLARLNSKGMFRAAEYSEKSGKLTAQINELRNNRKKLIQEQDENGTLSKLRKLENILLNIKEPLTEFDEDTFKAVVQKITFPSDTEICFELAGSLKITEKIPEKVIAQGLNGDCIPKANGKGNWTDGNIMSILRNEKYKGDALLQKTYVADCISKKTKKNNGELPMYYVENNFFELKKVGKYRKNKRMEDWLNLINAETEGDLMAIQQSTTIPEVQDTIVMLRHLSADQQVRQEAYYREKLLHDEASALRSARREGEEKKRS